MTNEVSGTNYFDNTLDIQNYYRDTQSNYLITSYKGAASGDLISSIIAVSQTKLRDLEAKNPLRKRVLTVLVEMLQNIYNHFKVVDAEDIKDDDAIVFVLGKTETHYHIFTGNYVATSDVPRLQERLEEINSLDEEALKAKYRDVLEKGEISQKGGAGLGLIEIARKSGGKLIYELAPVNPNFSFFSLSVQISAI